jgi:hypothetical protein
LAARAGRVILRAVPDQYFRGERAMFSVAVKGYGIVIWDDDGMWRTFSATESMSATLSARVEMALGELELGNQNQDAVCSALLSIAGAHLFSIDCNHGPDEPCGGDDLS